MSMTVTMNEAGLAELGQFLRRRFGVSTSAKIQVDEVSDGVMLKPQQDGTADDVLTAVIEYRDGKPFLTGTPPLSSEKIIRAIQQGRDERTDAGTRRTPAP
ncbi:MAG: hypothetical protein ABI318_02180 [Chthoniobacteraceae bacterium]